MGKNKVILIVLLFTVLPIFSNTGKYIVYFKDKPVENNIQQRFTPKAIENRLKYKIPFDERDYAINKNYLQQLYELGAEIKNKSNWLNAVVIQVDKKTLHKIYQLPEVQQIITIEKTKKKGIASDENINECSASTAIQTFEDTYISSFPQFNLLHGEYLHEKGYHGENMIVAICDNGFYNANTNPAFSNLFSDKRILGTYDYVSGDSLVFEDATGAHGAFCFSFMAAEKPNQYMGTATKAAYYLFQTENNSSERLQEEFNLATALERCSQLGVSVVSISLGYTTFDVPTENHDTADMKKNDTPAAKAVNIAASKGLLVCVAAGNEGTSPWHYISSPANADSAFTIASVDVNGNPAASSGWGLATDTRVKPNVAAVGQGAKFINTSGVLSSGNGTSFATPSLAGMATCLWQAFPNKTNWEIKTAIEKSASQYLTPDKKIGYGIPNFEHAFQILNTPINILENIISIYPNPFHNVINIEQNSNTIIKNIT
ncbi:MAG TPA: S8 family serine peptidase, partial [Chitinophagales bacterium]|nr:S8 family serine peptidase [Chitinophagales bacterium]